MQKIAILYDASQAVLSTFELDEVLQQILIIARDYFRLPNVSILLLDKETNELYVRSQIGWDQKSDGVRVPIGTGLIGTAAKEKRPVYVPDVSKDPRYLPCSKKTASELAIPLMVRDEVVGVLDCQSENLDHFDSETIDLLAIFSTQASLSLQNARLYSLERRRASQLEAINAIARETTAVLDIKQLLSRSCTKIQKSFQLSHVSVLLKEEQELRSDSETIDLLAIFSTQASLSLQNARLYSLERRRASQLEAINAIARETTAVLDIKQLLSRSCTKIQKSFQLSHVSVLLKEEQEL